jgi:uncharacterized protein (DUF2141 family)
MQSTSRIMTVLFTLLTLLHAGCASDRPPSGGPADNTPLRVIFSDPAPASTNAASGKIRLTFSHEISARQLTNSLLFYPAAGNYDVSVNGKDAEIRFYQPLDNNRTYTLSLDRNLRDYRRRTFSAPYTLAFSPGPAIDAGTIGGTVLNEDWSPATNALVLAFADQADKNSAATNLLTGEPDYLVQANRAGTFTFNNIKPGSYRIFAVNDRNSDRRYNYRSEETGQSSVALVSSSRKESTGILLRLTGLQSEAGTLLSCRPITQKQLEISLFQPVLTSSFDAGNVEIRPDGSSALVPVVAAYSKNRSMLDREFIVVTAGLKPAQPYFISLRSDEKCGKTGEIAFYSSSLSSLGQPLSVTILPENRSDPAYLDRAWPLFGKAVILGFSTPQDAAEIDRAVTLAESGNGTKGTIRFSLIKIDSRTFALKPEGGFKPGQYYTVSVNTGTIAGKTAKTVVSRFRTAAKEDTGILSGTCFAQGDYVVVEAKAAGSASSYSTTAQREKNGVFRYTFPELPPGSYSVSAFVPSVKKQPEPYRQWNPGSLAPYQPAEPFGLHAGPVMIRAQWSTANIDIHINSER